jgi:hypothetical protein
VESPEKRPSPAKGHKKLASGLMARIEDTEGYNASKHYAGARSEPKTSSFKVP